MYLLKIEGISKDQFYDICHMSAECKRVQGFLHAQYHLKRYLLEDLKDLQREHQVTYEIANLGRTPKSPIWLY